MMYIDFEEIFTIDMYAYDPARPDQLMFGFLDNCKNGRHRAWTVMMKTEDGSNIRLSTYVLMKGFVSRSKDELINLGGDSPLFQYHMPEKILDGLTPMCIKVFKEHQPVKMELADYSARYDN